MPPQTVDTADALTRKFGGTTGPVGPVAASTDADALVDKFGGSTQSLDDLVRSVAAQYKVRPELALAVARKESSLDPNAEGDIDPKTGLPLAIGMFQLHDAAAKDTNVDRHDPVQNIHGGVKYLRTLLDRYKGDESKALMAYNGGMKNVDNGTISPQAQTYAASVLADLSRSSRDAATRRPSGRASGAGPAGPGGGPGGRGTGVGVGPDPATIKAEIGTPTAVLKALAEPFDPRTVEGRQNLAGAAGSAALSMATRGLPVAGVLPWVARAIGPVLGAATAGATEAAVEQNVGSAPADPNAVAKSGLTQGLYEIGGQLVMWPFRKAGKSILASSVGKQAKATLGTLKEGLIEEGRGAIAAAKRGAADAMSASRDVATTLVEDAKARAGTAVAGAQQRAISTLRSARQQAAAALRSARDLAGSNVTGAKSQAAAAIAKQELDGAATVAELTKQYDSLIARPPSVLAAGDTARQTLGGLPGLQRVPEGPAKRALDIAGQRVAEAAEQGPAVQFSVVKDALDTMLEQERPTGFGAARQPAPRGVGFLANIRSAGSQMAASIGSATQDESAKLRAIISKQLGIPEDKIHPNLPGVLGEMAHAGDSVTFADAHRWKKMLDDAVNFDRASKKHIERITKGVRGTLREAMRGFAPYDQASAAYAALIPIYREGVGKEIITAAAHNPDKVARMLKADNPAQAQAIKDLFVTQSAAGGDAQIGQQAWDHVRANFVYDNVISGGIDGLSSRVRQVVQQSPEFAKVVFGDETAQHVLSNLDRIGQAYTSAVAQSTERLAAAKAAGQTGVDAAKAAGTQSVSAARDAARAGVQGVQDAGSAGIVRAREAAANDLVNARRTGTGGVDAARASGDAAVERTRAGAKAAVKGVTDTEKKLKASSVGAFTGRTLESEGADVLRGFGLGPKSIWGALSLIRLLESPSSGDLIQWAAFSNENTRRMVAALTGPVAPAALSNLIRDAVGIIRKPNDQPNDKPANPSAPETP